jgi:hypothetical protein
VNFLMESSRTGPRGEDTADGEKYSMLTGPSFDRSTVPSLRKPRMLMEWKTASFFHLRARSPATAIILSGSAFFSSMPTEDRLALPPLNLSRTKFFAM